MTPPEDAGWRRVAGPGFPPGLGPLWARRHDGGWEYGLELTAEHANATGAIHGGVLLALADHALSLTAWEAAGRQACVTVQLGLQFLRGTVPGQLLRARGRVARRTRHLVFMHGELAVGEDSVAAADGVWRVLGP